MKKIGLCVVVLASALSAQQTKVLPAGAATVNGSAQSYYPFVYTQNRTQMVVDGRALAMGGALLNGISFRRDAAVAAATFQPAVIPSLSLSLSHTTASPSTLSTTFAANVTSTPTVVFQGAYNLPAQPDVNPAPFILDWVFPQPFFFTRAQGNLLIDITVTDTLSRRSYFVDAERFASGTPGGAALFGSGGAFASADPYAVSCPTPARLMPGGSLAFEASGLRAQYPTLVAFGRSRTAQGPLPLPFDLTPLGAPGNSLLVELFTLQPLPLAQVGGSWSGTVALPVPADPWLAGFRLFAQALFLDQASNPFGLVLSQGVDYTLGFSTPIMQVMASYMSTVDGTLANFGLVTEFRGVIN